ncbi:DNA-3-methyladenine glycosylase family protein [Fictibacillus phosphorivorans]|uniref:DNA-3-methyladenine glycosylase family protein n=1 Tax=Fictibacillus phosphorivorans TaxID=1221500 RepID=UPI00203BA7B8|nr:DNA-3-methyladenine glycosylase [Fictibacillus phosphorivorans]MCM3717388.1 DNA-3-methyladenine glycosylase [Fictibacillus phosphorivorans]MCM3775083.1 DNA-3-methyladenine glycosylase [Fictibacillus phosphorivorans]
MNFSISPKPPFDFQKMMKRLTVTGKTHVLKLSDDFTQYEKIVQIDNRPCYLKIKSEGSVDNPVLSCQVIPIDGNVLEAKAKKKVQQLFSTELDLSELYDHFSGHTELGAVLNRFKGLKLLTETDLFEAIIKIIIGQQVNLTFAGTLTDRLIKRAGREIEVEGNVFQTFPSPESTAKLTYEDLRELQFSQRKAEYIIDLARMIVDGKLDLEELWNKSDEDIFQILLPLRGIGKWTIECLLIFGMGRPDILPAADIGLRNAVRNVWHLESQPSEDEVRQLAEDWNPWRTYITYYLWETLNQTPEVVDHT